MSSDMRPDWLLQIEDMILDKSQAVISELTASGHMSEKSEHGLIAKHKAYEDCLAIISRITKPDLRRKNEKL